MALIGMINNTCQNDPLESTHLQFDTCVACHLEGQSNDTRVSVETTHLFLQCILT